MSFRRSLKSRTYESEKYSLQKFADAAALASSESEEALGVVIGSLKTIVDALESRELNPKHPEYEWLKTMRETLITRIGEDVILFGEGLKAIKEAKITYDGLKELSRSV